MIRIGCSGWNYQHWRDGVFYPPRFAPRRWLGFYAEHFDTVEINMTFYRLPRDTAVAKWVEETPPDFIFAVKMSRYVTHIKRLRDLPPSLELFYSRIRPLVDTPKLGHVLWQLPATFQRDDERLAQALAQLPRGRHCFEFRHESWFAPEVYELLRRHEVALVIGDTPKRPFQSHELTADWTFIRFHEGTRGRFSNYSESELEEWAQRIERWAASDDVYAYFNNDRNGYAVRNALWLKERLR
ncbi:MAG: DUF72 domain-containing protein [Actinobacteria bacterium]|nr:MAG: DUF72 domain-containing protein [Actinomycetota bacterium]